MSRQYSVFALLVVVVLVFGILQGCQSAPAVQPTATAKSMPVRFPFDNPQPNFWKIQAEKFTQNDLAVDYQEVPFPQLHDKVQTSFLSGACDFDVVHIHELYMAEWASKGWLQPLEDIPGLLTKETLSDYPTSAVLKMVGPDGKEHTYGLDIYIWINSLYYRTDVLSKAGLDVPKTYYELLTTVKKLHSAEIPAFMVALGGSGATSLFGTIMRTEGGEILTNGKPSFNNAAGLKALNTMIELVKYTAPSSWAQMNSSKTAEEFVAGGAVFAIAPPPTLILAADASKSKIVGKVAVALMPGGSKVASATYSENGARAITACSPNKTAAAEYIKRVTSPAEMKDMTLTIGRVPVRFSVLNDPDVQAKYALTKLLPEQLKFPAGMTVVHSRGTEINKLIADQLVRAMKGEVTPQEALNQAESAVKAITN